MFGLYSGLARRGTNRKSLFFKVVGDRFSLPRSKFLAFCYTICNIGYVRPCPMHMTSLCRPFATKCVPIASKTCLYRHKRDKKIALYLFFVQFPFKFCSIKKAI